MTYTPFLIKKHHPHGSQLGNENAPGFLDGGASQTDNPMEGGNTPDFPEQYKGSPFPAILKTCC